ncbi:hypothetical protein AB0M86_41645 [Streptomyces sp. NPDC051639]|uniref:hypothetical protein n=1 Tax=Streptomyces sp. NPDC051639 TaxID=3155671 RepID=UPI0034196E06
MLGNGHAGFGRRFGETHQQQCWQGAPNRPHITQGKRHTQALLYLARRRVDVLFAMLRDGTFDESRPTAST